MRILTNDNSEYFGLVSDYKNGQAFKDAIIADGAEGKLAIIATILMRPLTDHELSEEGDYSTYEPGHWIPVDVPCETSDVFYHAVETEIPEPVLRVVEQLDESIDITTLNTAKDEPVNVVTDESEIVTVGENLFKSEVDNHDEEEDDSLYR